MTSWRSAWASWRACQRGPQNPFWEMFLKSKEIILYLTCILACILVICHPLRCFLRLYTCQESKVIYIWTITVIQMIQIIISARLWLQPCLSLQVVLFQLGFQLSFGTHLFPEAKLLQLPLSSCRVKNHHGMSICVLLYRATYEIWLAKFKHVLRINACHTFWHIIYRQKHSIY